MTTCKDCGDEWSGEKTGHCTRCCRTFSTTANFDKHLAIDTEGAGVYRVAGCFNPEHVVDRRGRRLLHAHTNRYGTTVWRGPPPTKARR